MDPNQDIGAALKAAKAEAEARTAELLVKIGRAQRAIVRYEGSLARIPDDLAKRVRELTSSYLEIPALGTRAPAHGRRARKLSLDPEILDLVRMLPRPIVTVPMVCDAWRRFHPDRVLGRTTVRNVLDRLADHGDLEVTDHGNRGRRHPREYRLTSVMAAAQTQEEVAP